MKKLLISLVAATLSLAALAQTEIRVEAPNMVAVDEQFNLTFVIEGERKPASFSWTIGSDFQLVWGPQKGTSSSVQIVNGKITKSEQYTYTYVLRATKKGRFTIPAATASVRGRQISSRTPEIEVLDSGASSQQPSAR